MEKRNPLTLTLDQPFVAGTDDFLPFYNRLHKLNCAIILYCRAGRGTMAIDLKKYEITVNTILYSFRVLLSALMRRAMIFGSPFSLHILKCFVRLVSVLNPPFSFYKREALLYTSFRIYRPH